MLELQDVSFHVAGESGVQEIVDNVSLTIEDGKFVVVTGPNGGGKSTLAKLIMGIERPTAGRIFWNGADITSLSVTQRAQMGIGYAFQQPPRFKGMTVRRLISLAHGEELPEDECCRYLSGVGLCSRDYLNREVDNSLSGGELKRIEIATLMARDLKLSIYDEPEAGIDLWSFAMLVDSFRALSGKKKESVLIISHQERIIQLADEIVVIAEGKVREQGPREMVFPRLMGEFSPVCGYQKGASPITGKARDGK